MTRSLFDNTQPNPGGNVRGGLDRYTASPAKGYSKMPPALDDRKANPSEQESDNINCDEQPDEAVCQIEQAQKRRRT